ncbi:hypothetical protein ACFE04_006975 [Oxalis oulophora]
MADLGWPANMPKMDQLIVCRICNQICLNVPSLLKHVEIAHMASADDFLVAPPPPAAPKLSSLAQLSLSIGKNNPNMSRRKSYVYPSQRVPPTFGLQHGGATSFPKSLTPNDGTLPYLAQLELKMRNTIDLVDSDDDTDEEKYDLCLKL